MTTFAAEVLSERARLALEDPEGESEAVAPLPAIRARQRLLDAAATRHAQQPWHRGDRLPDGRALLDRLGVDPARGRGVTRCPAHGEDRHPSLSWKLADDGRALLHCFSGCTFAEILAALR